MNFVILGAGAVGGFVGSKLQRSGNDVAFLVRQKRYDQLANEGLRMKSGGEDIRLHVNAITDVSEVNDCDVLILAVKNFSLSGVIESIRVLSSNGASVVSFLNGIEQMERIREVVPDEQITGGVMHLQADFDGEKIVQQGLEPSIILGSPSRKREIIIQSMADVFASAGLKTSVSDNILVDLWKKYIFITILSSLTAVCRAPIGAILRNQATYSLFEEICSEVVIVGKSLCPEILSLPLMHFLDQIKNLPGTMTASMARDTERGLPTEVEYIQGYLIRKARELGLSVPATTFCYRILKLREKGSVAA